MNLLRIVIVPLLLSFFQPKFCLAQPPKTKIEPPHNPPPIIGPSGRVIVLVMDGLSYRHVLPQGLSAFSEIGEWLERNGSMALLNTMGYGGSDSFRAAMTIACGVRAFADETAALVLQANEPLDADTALNAYRRRIGNFPLPRVQTPFEPLVFPMLSELRWRNERFQRKPVSFGVVVQSLWQQKGIKVVGIGCGDLPTDQNQRLSPFRHGLLMVLNESGLGMGLTETKLMRHDPKMPYGLAIDESRWREIFNEAWHFADVIVLFPGETFRADLYGSERLIPLAIRRELNLLRPAVERINLKRDLLIVFSLAPSRRNRYELSFISAVGKGVEPNGLLTSLTTHCVGLVSILDIPAAILHFFGVEPFHPITGSPITSTPGLDKMKLWGMGAKAQATDTYMRTIVLVSWCLLQAVVFSAIAFSFLRGLPFSALIAEVPMLLAFLTAGLHLSTGLPPTVGLFSALAVAVLWSIVKTVERSRGRSFAGVTVFAVLVFVADATRLLPLSIDSPFGYSSFFGGRYYGQGNVAMGLTLGSIFALAIALNWQRWATAFATFVGAVLVGTPFLGANIGGALTGLVLSLASFFTGRFRWWYLFVATVAFAVLFGSFTVFELTRPEPLTHWGRFARSVVQEGIGIAASMVWTKFGISLRAFRAIHWDIALLAQLFLTVVLWWREGRDWKLMSLFVGIVAAMLFNDSGPQTPVAFAFLPLCLLSQRRLCENYR